MILTVKNLSVTYGAKTAVNNISFSVEPGEVIGLLGANGAGKSSTIAAVLGVEKSHFKEITMLGKSPILHRKEVFQEVGVQFQETNFQDKLIVLEACEHSIRLLEELLVKNPDAITGGTILDLGCGKALTSVYIANETNAKTVYATDLWISATENWETIQEWKLEDKMIPIHANALDLPFANDFFDAIVSIDSYHYYGCEEEFFAKKMLPLLKSGGYALICVPGLKSELEQVPELMNEWLEDAVDTFHSTNWWGKHIQQGCDDLIEVMVYESDQFEACWQDWINTGNEYALNDAKFLNRGLNELLNFVMIVVRKK